VFFLFASKIFCTIFVLLKLKKMKNQEEIKIILENQIVKSYILGLIDMAIIVTDFEENELYKFKICRRNETSFLLKYIKKIIPFRHFDNEVITIDTLLITYNNDDKKTIKDLFNFINDLKISIKKHEESIEN
jgi:archaellum biogenesis ATPase FlaH